MIAASILLFAFELTSCSDSFTDFGENETVELQNSAANNESDDDLDDTENREVNVITSVMPSDPEQDPYTVENMNKALKKVMLAKSGSDSDAEDMQLEPNYLYVRFLAKGQAGERELKAYDTSLVLHPMDYKQIKKPVYYKDPTLPDSVVPYFATVPVDYHFGPTEYEVIKELFLVEPLDGDCDEEGCDESLDSAGTAKAVLKKATRQNPSIAKLENMGVSLHEIEWESLQMTGNLEERLKSEGNKNALEQPKLAWSLFGGGFRPSGTLKFMDDQLGEQPLVGVRVTGGYSYYWREGHTDKNGYFKIPEKWTFDIDYEANFDSEDFLLEDGHSWYGEDLEIEKNNKKSAWNETFTGNKAKWCVVWTAAYQYWYGDAFGLKRPRQNEWYNWSLDIEVYYKNEKDYKKLFSSNSLFGCNADESVGQYGNAGIFENICILAYNKSSNQIFGTTIHEVAHSSHYANMKTTNTAMPAWTEFEFTLPNAYKESYARGIQNYFIRKRYGESKYHSLKSSYNKTYTGIVEDLIDANDISDCGNQENVSGFSLQQIETSFLQNKSFSAMKKHLMNNNPSGKNNVKYTTSSMNNLFSCWGL